MSISYIKVAAVILSVLVSFGIGIIIGYFSHSPPDKNQNLVNYYNTLIHDYDKNGLASVVKVVNPENIKQNLRYKTLFRL
jgi:hypothetical protein